MIWRNDGLAYWRVCASLSLDELTNRHPFNSPRFGNLVMNSSSCIRLALWTVDCFFWFFFYTHIHIHLKLINSRLTICSLHLFATAVAWTASNNIIYIYVYIYINIYIYSNFAGVCMRKMKNRLILIFMGFISQSCIRNKTKVPFYILFSIPKYFSDIFAHLCFNKPMFHIRIWHKPSYNQ